MITRDKIHTEIIKLMKKKLEESFLPIIEEFFFRVADQCDWTEYDLNNAISRYESVDKIKFFNFWERKSLFNKQKMKAACVEMKRKTNKLCIYFDVDKLKSILRFEKDKIEYFINEAMHEQGHVIQTQEKEENKRVTGFNEMYWNLRKN